MCIDTSILFIIYSIHINPPIPTLIPNTNNNLLSDYESTCYLDPVFISN